MTRLRALPSLSVLAFALLGALACEEDEGEKYVDPDTVTEASVRAAVTAEVATRLETHAASVIGLEVELLIHEVRQLEEREEPSDLAIAWCTWSADGTQEWALGQLYRHRSGDISWQWFEVFTPDWLPFRVYEEAPDNDDVLAFLTYWDFEVEGQNGALVAGEVKAETWREVIGAEPPVAYPEGTEAP